MNRKITLTLVVIFTLFAVLMTACGETTEITQINITNMTETVEASIEAQPTNSPVIESTIPDSDETISSPSLGYDLLSSINDVAQPMPIEEFPAAIFSVDNDQDSFYMEWNTGDNWIHVDKRTHKVSAKDAGFATEEKTFSNRTLLIVIDYISFIVVINVETPTAYDTQFTLLPMNVHEFNSYLDDSYVEIPTVIYISDGINGITSEISQ